MDNLVVIDSQLFYEIVRTVDKLKGRSAREYEFFVALKETINNIQIRRIEGEFWCVRVRWERLKTLWHELNLYYASL